MNNSLADKLQLWGFEENLLVFRDGSLGAALKLSPLDVTCLDLDIVNNISQKQSDFLNGLPQGLSCQFMQEVVSGNTSLIQENANLMKESATDLTKEIAAQRTHFLNEEDQCGNLPKQNLYLFLRMPLQSTVVEKPKWFSFMNKNKDIVLPIHKLKGEIDSFKRKLSEIQKGLELLEIQSKELDQRSVFKLIYNQWNPSGEAIPASINSDDVRDRLLLTDGVTSLQGFSLGNFYHKVISLKVLPDQTFATMAEVLRELPFDSRLFLTVEVMDQEKEISALQLQRRLSFSMVAGKKGVADLESEAKLQDIEALLTHTISGQERIFKTSLNILLRSTSEEALEDQVSGTLQKIRQLSGAEGMLESIAAFDIFTDFSLPNARTKERTIKMNTSVLADFLPLYGFWSGHEKPRVVLKNRFGSLVKFDPFSSEMTNANQIISGGSGAGKSFLTNLVISQMLKEKPKVFILDIGGSYQKLSQNLNGQYIPLGASSGLSINPFDLDGLDESQKDQKIKFLVSMVELMTKESDSKHLGRLERSELENLILKLLDEKKKPTLTDLKELLIDHEESALKRIGKILTTWCGETPYGKFVDRETNIKLTSDIICFDLKGLETHPELQSVCLFLITDLVWREVQKDRINMKFVVFDECWKLLENEAGSQFIAEVFRTFRKYYASAVAISQTMDDFSKSKIASAIMPNSSIKWILKQKGANLESLKSALQLNDREIGLVTSLRSEKGEYSEAFLMCEDKRGVVRVEAIPLEYWLFTTDPKDLSLLNDLKNQNQYLSDFEILRLASENYPKGASQADLKKEKKIETTIS
jgi:type-IV secretion system protein TraC